MPRKRSPLGRRIDQAMIRWATQIAAKMLGHLSVEEVQQLGDSLGVFIQVAWPSRQRLAERDLQKIFGDRLSAEDRRRIRDFCTRNAAKTVLELLRLPTMTEEERDELFQRDYENFEVIDQALERGSGVIMVTAHFGNWELLAAAIARRSPHPLTVVARDSNDRETASIINKARASSGMRVIGRSQVREMLRTLQEGGILGMLPDQYVKSGGIVVDFMGVPAPTATGPAVLALRTGAPIVPCFGLRTEDDRIVCYFKPPFDIPDTGDRERDIRRGTEMINEALGEEIFKHPEQWLWLHNRWHLDEKPETDTEAHEQ
ncbi:MAG: lysophospholipid acyltransferase family protein [Armatimonadetes bacterium]|nr:lysophospholipid acyltransferase family protein [Armatimonadota bacterium]